jgi:hypothetical protein
MWEGYRTSIPLPTQLNGAILLPYKVGNLSLSIGSLTERSEPIGDKTRITGVGGARSVRRKEFIITTAGRALNPVYLYLIVFYLSV